MQNICIIHLLVLILNRIFKLVTKFIVLIKYLIQRHTINFLKVQVDFEYFNKVGCITFHSITKMTLQLIWSVPDHK